MTQRPLAFLLLLSICGWSQPNLAQDLKAQTLSACQTGVTAVTAGHPQLEPWAQFYRQRAQPQQTATTNSQPSKFAVVALSELELAQQRRIGLFEFDPAQTRLYLMTVPMTPAWRGLGCLRETVMAKERLSGTLSGQATPSAVLASKVKAYQTQLSAANHVTKGAFGRTVQRLLAQRRYHNSEGLLVPNTRAIQTLDRVFPQPAVLSPHERGLRNDFYLVAFNFARQSNPSQRAAILGKLY